MRAFHCPVEVRAGAEASRAAAEVLAARGVASGTVLVLVDPACAALDLHDGACAGLTAHGFRAVVAARGRPNPTLADAAAALADFTAAGASAIVAVGGGSTIDLAKGVAAAARVGPDLSPYGRGGTPIPTPLPPVVAVPTTAGSGSEVTPFATLVDPAAGAKVILSSPALYPVAALLDPPLLVPLPRTPLVAAGLDAVTHALESFLGLRATPAVDALALGSLGTLWWVLPEAAARTGADRPLDALLWAATLAGVAVANGSAGIVHAVSNVLAARYGVSHGLANAAVLAPVLAFLAPAAPVRFARLATVLGVGSGEAVPGSVAEFVRRLAPDCSLGALGVRAADLPALARALADDYQVRFNSVRVPDEEALRGILMEAF